MTVYVVLVHWLGYFCEHTWSVSIWCNKFVTVQILRFPQQCSRGFWSFGMSHCIVACLQNISIQLRPWMLESGDMLVGTVQKHLASDTASHLKRLEFLSNCLSSFVCITFVPDSPTSLLGCGCSGRLPGKVALEIGPVWSGSIFSEQFLVAMHLHSLKFPWKDKAGVLLLQLLREAR